MWKSRWTSWAPVPNKPTVSVDVKQHFNGKLDETHHHLGTSVADSYWPYAWCLTSTETVRLIRDGEKGGGRVY